MSCFEVEGDDVEAEVRLGGRRVYIAEEGG